MSDESVIQQRSPEWFEARLGRATASRFKDILTTIRNGEAAARRNYRAELVAERLTGVPFERFRTKEMEYGTATEELARVTYQLVSGNIADETGFWKHPTLAVGASPDGLIGEDGCLEVKCKNLANHIEALKTEAMPEEHHAQVQGQFWITGRKWADFVSFAPELPENAQLMIVRVERDDEYIKMLEQEVKKFLEEVRVEVEFIKNYKRENKYANSQLNTRHSSRGGSDNSIEHRSISTKQNMEREGE